MAITSLADYKAARKCVVPFATEVFNVATLNNCYLSLMSGNNTWSTNQLAPSIAAAASGGTVLTKASNRCLNFSPPSAALYVGRAHLSSPTITLAGINNQRAELIDAYWMCGVDGQITTAQTVTGFPSYSRTNTTGEGLLIGLSVASTATLSSPTTLTVSYTNSAGVAGRTATFVTSSSLAGMAVNIPLQPGDTGVQSIQSFQQSAINSVASTNYVFLYESLLLLPSQMHAPVFKRQRPGFDIFSTGLTPVDPQAALTFLFYTSNSAVRTGFIELVYG